jgi:polysaccharide pyruvyl transferase WcaK-like protein
MNRNMGDNALNLAIRGMLRPHFRIRHTELLQNTFPRRELRRLDRADLIVFGGGGLIHSYGPRGNPWTRTGTMWDIHLEDLRRLRAPVVCYGVGFNHFHGDPAPLPRMRELFSILRDRGSLIAFRNDGSRGRFLQHFPEFDGVVQEIPDTGVFFRPKPRSRAHEYAVLQIAADRPHFRYGKQFEKLLQLVNTLCEKLPMPIVLVPHTIDDDRLYREFRTKLTKVTSVWPLRTRPRETAAVVGLYAGASLTISTRGHSQILSVGNAVPTFSISTHPKVAGFAEACGMSRWCIDFSTTSIADARDRFTEFLASLPAVREELKRLQDRFDRQVGDFNRQILEMTTTHQAHRAAE